MSDPSAIGFAIPFADSLAFAELSGDCNPLHVDPVAARRTQFGGSVVHGIHLLLKSMDLLADRWAGSGEPASLSVSFNNPVRSEAQVSARVTVAEDGARVRVAAESGGRPAFSLNLATASPRPGPDAGLPLDWRPPAGRPRDLAFPPPALDETLPLGLDLDLLAGLLPGLARLGRFDWVADLLASTRIVGMQCPGLHSIYAGLKLTRRKAEDRPSATMRYRIERTDPRFRSARLAVAGACFEGALETFFRPPAVQQRALAEVAQNVPPGLFGGQKALVVGGSRGLGEIAAKILLAGGAEVAITYARGQADAERVQAEAQALGLRCTVRALDAAVPPDEAQAGWLTGGGFSHLYFFASPPIEKNGTGRWRHDIFERLSGVYLRGFAGLVETLARGAGKSAAPLRVLYPSTVFLDDDEPGFAEYCAAKAAGEALARQLARELGVVIAAPRLPRMRTDQTSALIDAGAADAFPVMLELMRGLRA